MADVQVWEEGDVNCSLALTGSQYSASQVVVFIFKRKDDDSEIERVTATVVAGWVYGYTASCKWKAKKTGADELFYVARYEVTIDGTPIDNLPEEITVWAKSMTCEITRDTGGKFKGALVRFTQETTQSYLNMVGIGTNVLTALRRADDNGLVKYDLQTTGPVTVALERPYELVGGVWTKPAGKKREATAKLGYIAKIVWPVEDVTDHVHKQWVNLAADTAHPEFGMVVKFKIKPTVEDQGAANDPVHLKALYDGANTDRTARAGETAKGGAVTVDTVLDGSKTAIIEVRLGPSGGEKVTVSVGSTAECLDQTVVIQTWRRLYYQLKGPKFITDILPVTVLPDATNGFDLPTALTAQVKAVLDPGFLEYKVLKSFSHANNLYPAHQRLASEYIGRPAGDTVLMQSINDYNTDLPTAFASPDDRTILIKLCDGACSTAKAVKTVEKTLTTKDLEVAFTTDYGSLCFLTLLDTGGDAVNVTGCEWEAVVTGLDAGTVDAPGPDAAHPAFDNHVARRGAVDRAWIEPKNQYRLWIKLPDGVATNPGSFVGPQGTALKCPVKLKFFVTVHDGWINGCALGNRQLMIMKPASPKCVAATLCHELGHTMGMTMMPGRNRVPYGLPAPKHVDNGGDYYRNTEGTEVVGAGLRSSHQGPHCAAGIGDKTTASLANKAGTCILYGEGGSDDNTARAGFCATCVKYLKARNLTDIRTTFQAGTRADEDC